MELGKYFDEKTMSVHLRENSLAMAKKGVPGNWKIEPVSEKKLTQEDVKELAQKIANDVENQEKSFLEIEREGSSIIQLGEFRIVITRPPFSDGWEITAVRPVAKLNLDDYKLDKELMERLVKQAEGVLIAGSPGEGKTTLARALAEHYNKLGGVVKTIESPRDMLLGDDITQYSLTYGERDEIYDVLLLSRPDHTIFDEIRNTNDFQLFTDLRLAGIGMVGVMHATDPIDAIQRFIGRIEMGVIPQVIDTVVFVKGGKVDTVLNLKMRVKVPSGMTEADLARPIVEIRDFFSGKLEFEIYTYGEQTIVIPVEKETSGVWKLVERGIKNKLNKYTNSLEIEMISDNKANIYVPEHAISKIIGRQGKEIDKIEKELGLKIDVRELKEKRGGKDVEFDVEVRKNIVFYLEKRLANKDIDLYSGDEFLVSTKSSKKAMVKVSPNSEVGNQIRDAVKKGTIRLVLVR
ncbi:Flp pilus assembly complex ATPase component TadA [Candidatus Woesearchaeota archaeon]|nr:Flp pilus assembly complex ATPase component TadA [Candidatus Woesearchaeota archaeon]